MQKESLVYRLSTVFKCKRYLALQVFFTFLVLPNIIFLFPFSIHFPRALVNIDYLLLGALSIFLAPRIVPILFLMVGAIDLCVIASRMYNFDVEDLFSSYKYIHLGISIHLSELPIWYLAMFLAFLLVGAATAACVAASMGRKLAAVLLAAYCFFGVADALNGSSGLYHRLSFFNSAYVVPANLASSAIIVVAEQLFYSRARETDWRLVPSATKVAMGLAPSDDFSQLKLPPGVRNLSLIIVESWGHGNDNLDKWVASPLLVAAIRENYDIQFGAVPYWGATARGEMRELCGADTGYVSLSPDKSRLCLPAVLQAQGYRTVGFHGFSGIMYERQKWWPKIGIGEAVFLSEMGNKRFCGVIFPGACDEDVLEMLKMKLLESKPTFGYVLTLNSHLPLPMPSADEQMQQCGAAPVSLDGGQCGLVISWRKVFKNVARMATSTRSSQTQFVIVGDHAPPLWSGKGAGPFKNSVPYIILRPRNANERPG